MSKVDVQNALATPWPELKKSMDAVLRQLIHDHSLGEVAKSRRTCGRVPWETRVMLYVRFAIDFPTVEIEMDEYMHVLRDVHDLVPSWCRNRSVR